MDWRAWCLLLAAVPSVVAVVTANTAILTNGTKVLNDGSVTIVNTVDDRGFAPPARCWHDGFRLRCESRNEYTKIFSKGIIVAIAFGGILSILIIVGCCVCCCKACCRSEQTTQTVIRTSHLAPATPVHSIQVGPRYPYPQGQQPYNQPWPHAQYGAHQPQQPYPPPYDPTYPQQQPYPPGHPGATAPSTAPTAPPASFEQMPMPPPPYEYKETRRY